MINKQLAILIGATVFACVFLLFSSANFTKIQDLSISHFVGLNISEEEGEATPVEKVKLRIIIIAVVTNPNISFYQRAVDSLKCYSLIHNYTLVIAVDTDFKNECKQRDLFFRRHCVVAQFLGKCDYLLFLDADMGVVNPAKKIEEYVDPKIDVTFYDRFYNQEIVAGAYLLKNSAYALDFIKGYADYENKLPNAFHGTDNGGLHAYVLSKLYSNHPEDYRICIELYNKSSNYDDLFAYESCARAMIGINEEVKNFRFFRKGEGWARDAWLTRSLWNPQRDFILHGWKTTQLIKYNPSELPIKPTHSDTGHWFDPIIGEFDFDKCVPGNISWNFDPNLIASVEVINSALEAYRIQTDRDKFARLAYIQKRLNISGKKKK